MKKRKKKTKFLQDFSDNNSKSCKNNSKTLFLHCIGLYLIITIWSLDFQRRPTVGTGVCGFFFSEQQTKRLIANLPFQAFWFNILSYFTL